MDQETSTTGGEAKPRSRGDPRAHGAVIADRFVLEARIGKGRNGDIYQAQDGDIHDRDDGDRRVALQFVRPDVVRSVSLRKRFKEGFLRLRAWSHPNIVKLLELGRDGETMFLTSQLLEGASLRFIVDEIRPALLDRRESLAVIRGVGEALEHAHARGVVHGDIRLANVFVTDDYAVKLLDFVPNPTPGSMNGLLDAPSETQADTISACTASDDVYALACLAYELFAGKHPYGGSLRREALQAGLEPAPPEILSPAEWRALRRGLELDPDRRTPTVAGLLHDLGITGTENLPVVDRPETVRALAEARIEREATDARVRDSGQRTRPRQGSRPRAARRVALGAAAVFVAGAAIAAYVYVPPVRLATRAAIADVRERVTSLVVATPIDGGGPEEVPPRAEGLVRREATAEPRTVVEPETSGQQEPAAESEANPEPNPEAETYVAADADLPVEPRGLATAPASPPVGAPTLGETLNDVAPAAETASAARDPRPRDESASSQPSRSADAEPAPPARVETQAAAPGADASPAVRPDLNVPAHLLVSEGEIAAPIVIERDGSTERGVTLAWWTTADSASNDEDFAGTMRKIETLPPGEATQTFYIPIIADSLPERSERFFVDVAEYSPAGAPVAAPKRIEVTIVDDDPLPSIR